MPTVRARAKVNLYLHVLGREASGYHQIETVFCLIDLADELVIADGEPGILLEIDGVVPGDVRDNLVCRAVLLFHEKIGTAPALRILLRKRIPVGAGLGGGSSDGAATLLALNEMHGSPLGRDEMMAAAATLGSDVPFFAARSPLALGRGRGDQLTPLPSLPPMPIVVASPASAMNTAEAYGALDSHREHTPAAPRHPPASTWSTWDDVAAMAHNDFEPVVLDHVPAARSLRNALADSGARIAMLSGSGSSVFGVFDDDASCSAAAAAARAAVPDARVFETRSAQAVRR